MKFGSLLAFLFLATFGQAQSLTLRTFFGATHQAVQFTSPQKGFAIAYADTLGALPQGVLRKTIDGGVTWKTVPITFSPTLPNFPGVNTIEVRNHLQMFNENVGYCAGELNTLLGSQGMVLKTNNGGTSWTGTPIPKTDLPIRCIYFTNETTGYVATEDVYKTTNSGATWSKVLTPGGSLIQTIYFINETTGFACAPNKLFKTTDAGLNWETIDLPSGVRPSSMKFISNTTGFFTTETNGRIYGTTDGGATWNLLYSELNTRLSSIFVVNNVIVVGGYSTISTTCNTFLVKSDNGVNWKKECFNFEFPKPRYVYSTYFLSEEKGFLGVDGGLYEYSTKLLPQTIIGFNPIPKLTVGGTYTITGVTGGGSGNPIVFTSSDPSVVSISGNVIKVNKIGSVVITATQAGNLVYASALPVNQNLSISTTTSTVEAAISHEVSAFPNPTTGLLTIEFSSKQLSKKVSVAIHNVTGVLVKQTNAINLTDNAFQLDLNDLSAGTYFIHIKTDKTSYNQKILIAR